MSCKEENYLQILVCSHNLRENVYYENLYPLSRIGHTFVFSQDRWEH